MHDYHSGNLPSSFNSFFIKVNQRHSYNTRLASKISFSLPQVRTNYGKFNIRSGVKVWNSIDKLKTLKKSAFKKKLKDSLDSVLPNLIIILSFISVKNLYKAIIRTENSFALLLRVFRFLLTFDTLYRICKIYSANCQD